MKTKQNKLGKFVSKKQDNDTKQDFITNKDAKYIMYQSYRNAYVELWIKGKFLTDFSSDIVPIKLNLLQRLIIRLFFGLTIIQKERKLMRRRNEQAKKDNSTAGNRSI